MIHKRICFYFLCILLHLSLNEFIALKVTYLIRIPWRRLLEFTNSIADILDENLSCSHQFVLKVRIEEDVILQGDQTRLAHRAFHTRGSVCCVIRVKLNSAVCWNLYFKLRSSSFLKKLWHHIKTIWIGDEKHTWIAWRYEQLANAAWLRSLSENCVQIGLFFQLKIRWIHK